jgi:hypothetical protein
MYGRLEDWGRVTTRHDRCQIIFFSAIALTASALF